MDALAKSGFQNAENAEDAEKIRQNESVISAASACSEVYSCLLRPNVINLTDGFIRREEFSKGYLMVSRIFSSRSYRFNSSLKNILQLGNQLRCL